MSFGISISDFVILGQFAFGIYQRCRDGPKELQDLCPDIEEVITGVETFGDTLNGRDLTPGQEAFARRLHDGCEKTLAEIRDMLAKYENIPKNGKRTLKWIFWGSPKAPDIRKRLNLICGLLTLFNTTLTATGIARIEKYLSQLQDGFQASRRQGSVISSSSLHEAERGNENIWREISRALEDEGISESIVSENRDYIVNWLSRALKEGELEETLPQDELVEESEMSDQRFDNQDVITSEWSIRRGETLIPKTLVLPQVIVGLGLSYAEEGQTVVIGKALGKREIDKMLLLSKNLLIQGISWPESPSPHKSRSPDDRVPLTGLDFGEFDKQDGESNDLNEGERSDKYAEKIPRSPLSVEAMPLATIQASVSKASILFLDVKSTVRSFMAQAYLEYLRNRHSTLQNAISIIDSAGLEMDSQPSTRYLQGVKMFLAKQGISANFNHVPERLSQERLRTFTHILTLNQHEIRHVARKINFSIYNHSGCRLLGTFGNMSGKDTDVREPEGISGREWYAVEKATVYSGYEKCFSDIKEQILRFISNTFHLDVMVADCSLDKPVTWSNS